MKIKIIITLIILSICIQINCAKSDSTVDTTPPEITLKSPSDAQENVAVNTNISVTFNKEIININNDSFYLIRLGTYGTIPASINYINESHTAVLDPDENLEYDTVYAVTITNQVKSKAGIPIASVSWAFSTGEEADNTVPEIVEKNPSQSDYVPVDTEISVIFSEAILGSTLDSDSFYITEYIDEENKPLIPSTVTYDPVLFKAELTLDSGILEEWTSYTIYLKDTITDLAGNSLPLTELTFKTDDVNQPTVVSRYPEPGSADIPVNAAISVTFSESLRTSTIHDNVNNFQLMRESIPGVFELTDYAVIYDDSTKTATLNHSGNLEQYTSYRVILSSNITDLAYNQLENSPIQWDFMTKDQQDTTPPAVTSVYPANNATSILSDTGITIRFSEDVTGVDETSFTIERQSDSAAISGNIIYNPSTCTAIYTPQNLLTEGIWYRVRLTSAIKDYANPANQLPAFSSVFKTADSIKPAVVSKYPPADAGNIAVNINYVSATFNEEVTGVTGSSFILRNETGSQVEGGTASFNSATKTAYFYPDDDLNYESEYSATLTNSIADTSGNTLNQIQWTFYTGDELDSTPPDVVSPTYPAAGAVNIPCSAIINIYFSEPVTGIGPANVMLKKGDENGTLVNSNVTFDSSADRATITPNNYMDNATIYTVVVKGGLGTDIQDIAGNKPAADITWSFTTIADTAPPTITYKTPAQGTPDVPGNAVTVTVIFSEQVQGVDTDTFKLIRTSDSFEVPVNVGYTYDALTNTASATLTPLANVETTGTYRAELNNGITDISPNTNQLDNISWTFEITALDVTAPYVVIRTPGQGDVNWINGIVSVIFSEDVSGVNAGSFYVKDDEDNTLGAVVTYSAGLLTARLEILETIEYEKTYTAFLTATVKDRANNQLVPVSWSFSSPADIVPPSVSSVYPPDNTAAFPVNGQICAVFSEDISGYSASSFYLVPAASATPTYDPGTRTLTLPPDSDLQGSTEYTVHITTGITDTATVPNNLAEEYTWSFTTQTLPDETAPTIVPGSRNPGSGATGVSLAANVSVTFSEHVVNATSKISLKQGTTSIPASVSYNPGTYTATLNPQDDLNESTEYTVYVQGGPTGIQDPSGNYLAATDSWSFTTEEDTTAPVVLEASKYPVPDATNVKLKPVITATFSEPVTGVNSSSFYLTGAGVPTCYVVYDEASRTATLTPGSNLSNDETYTVRLNTSIEDRASNPLALTEWSFTVSSLPEINEIAVSTNGSDFTPVADNATNINYAITHIRITFSTSMNTEKQWMEIFQGATGNTPSSASPGAWTWAGDTVVTYNITGRFSGNTAHQVRLYGWGGTFEDTDGNTVSQTVYVGNGIWNFTTAADNTAPAISTSIPASGATGVGRDVGRIIIRFNEMMNKTRDSRITLTPAATATRTGWIDGGRTAIFTIPQLNASTFYTVTLGSGGNTFQDIAATPNNASGSFTFTTGSSTGSTVIDFDSFENYTNPDFSIFSNISADTGGDWAQLATDKSGNGGDLAPQDGTYFAKGAFWEWDFGDYADIELNDPLDFSTAGTYVMTFDMFHERLYNNIDRLQAYLSANGADYTQITSGATANGILRYDWSLGNDNPAWQTHFIDLSQYSGPGYGSVRLKLRAISAGETGGNIIIDNVEITGY